MSGKTFQNVFVELIAGVDPNDLSVEEIEVLANHYGSDWIESTLDISDGFRANEAHKEYLNDASTGENWLDIKNEMGL